MQGLEATFDDLSFEGGDSPQRVLPKIVPFGAALAFAGAVSVWALHGLGPVDPGAVFAWWTPAPTGTHAISRPFADIAIDANLAAQLNSAAPAAPQQVASLELAAPFPLPKSRRFSALHPGDPAGREPAAAAGARCARDRRDRKLPLPPARPPGFGAPTVHDARAPCVTTRHCGRSSSRPARQPQCLRETLRWAHPSSPGVAPPPRRAPPRLSRAVAQRDSAAAAGGLGRGPLFNFPSIFGNSAPGSVSGYDRYTAVYDISARVVYLPDGTKLEAHSGLGQALDNPRYVAERAVGPTPPHVYELTLREGSFHGVQAIRLNPVGEGGIYGRAGLLAHPFMLGPNGDFERLRVLQGLRSLLARLPERADQEARGRRQAVDARPSPSVDGATPLDRIAPRSPQARWQTGQSVAVIPRRTG